MHVWLRYLNFVWNSGQLCNAIKAMHVQDPSRTLIDLKSYQIRTYLLHYLPQKVLVLTARKIVQGQSFASVSSWKTNANAFVTSPSIKPGYQAIVQRLLPLAPSTQSKMAADMAVQSADIENDFLEESLSKPIFYSPEVEEAISQVSKIYSLCILGRIMAVIGAIWATSTCR